MLLFFLIFPNLIYLILEFVPESFKTLVKNDAPGNEQYWSKTVQNEIIQVFAEYIKGKIVSEVKESRYFTLLANESNDISHKEKGLSSHAHNRLNDFSAR